MGLARGARAQAAAGGSAAGLLPRRPEPTRRDRSRATRVRIFHRGHARAGPAIPVRSHEPPPRASGRRPGGEASMSARQPAPALDRANSEVVLIVDDVPDNLSLLHDALDESGYTVLVATGGEAALQRAAQALPD